MNNGDYVVITQPGHASRHKHGRIVGKGRSGGGVTSVYFVQLASGTTIPISPKGIRKL
jgi:hypothetical protein